MPEIKYYTVRQIREVEVAANDELGAAAISTQAFNGDEATDREVWGYVVREPRVTDLDISRDR